MPSSSDLIAMLMEKEHEEKVAARKIGRATGIDTSSVQSMMQEMPQEDKDYFVNITRRDLPINPETGKPGGWEKEVHRFTSPKGEKPKKKRAVS